VTELLTRNGRVEGVRAGGHDYRARLVIGADGYRSTVAGLAGAATDTSPNNRFGLWAYYRGLPPVDNRIWMLDPDVGIIVRTDDDLTMLIAFPGKAALPEFRADRPAALETFIRKLPDAPDLTGAERVSPVIGMTDYPCVRRDPTPLPGLMLVGDAALTGDPQPAVGCGWAFRAAEWLVESTAGALRGEASMRSAGTAYRRRLRFILGHDRLARQAALAGPANPVQRTIFRAATVDPYVRRRAYLFSMRAIPVSGLLNPVTLGRAAWSARRAA
jgi:flavin-dependent dehydrogenase